MKDEIKESINRIKSIVDFYKLNDENNYDYSDDVLISMKILLEYITNLQKERNMFKNSFETMSKNYFKEKSRNEKAIELLNREYWINEHEHNDKVIDELLNILQGGFNE